MRRGVGAGAAVAAIAPVRTDGVLCARPSVVAVAVGVVRAAAVTGQGTVGDLAVVWIDYAAGVVGGVPATAAR
eukprot:12713-Prymnesium_polylepis.1